MMDKVQKTVNYELYFPLSELIVSVFPRLYCSMSRRDSYGSYVQNEKCPVPTTTGKVPDKLTNIFVEFVRSSRRITRL
jgi:hypothetical protein